MADEIYKGVDCCSDALRPSYDLRISPASAELKPGEAIWLEAIYFNIIDCDPGCISWRHVKGGGTLNEEFGTKVAYTAPDENEACGQNAIIALMCGGTILDLCYIAINAYTRRGNAYRVSTLKPHGFYPNETRGKFVSAPEPHPREAPDELYQVNFYWREYHCDGKLISEYIRYQYQFLWTWKPQLYRWQLCSTVTASAFDCYNWPEDIPWEKIKDEFPRIEDRRTERMKAEGCCPRPLWTQKQDVEE